MSKKISDMQEPSERESFDNFLDYNTELNEKYSISLNTKNRKVIYTAVINELRERNLVNKAFYENELETYSFIEDDMDEFKETIYMLLNVFIFMLFYGILMIIVMRQLPLILTRHVFNNAL
tara:strand:+ start:287 stop:649 length:363 start_codon:yes stop_codon:yes gene_type:complete